MSKSRFNLFLENFLFYGGLSMLTKALPFVTLPIITKMLPDARAYGIADMFNLINTFGTAIAVLGMYDAIFREFFEDKENMEYQKKVTSTGLGIVMFSSLIIFILIVSLSNSFSLMLFKTVEYRNLINLSAFAVVIGALSSILASPTRMRNQRKIYLLTGIGFPLIGFICTYTLITKGYTYKAIVYSNVLMGVISLLVFYCLNRKDFSFKYFDKKIARELFKIGLPLLPTFLIYWIFNSMDRIMINRILGSTELGIYSVGSKVASVSQLIYTAFAGGWSYFAFSTMKDKDQVELNSKVFEYLGIISFLAFIIAQPFIKPVFNMFFSGQYRRGSEVFSYLFLSPLILMLFQIVGNQVIVIKKTYLSTVSLIAGAILNIVLNYFLIIKYGIKGAALSTLLSYILSLILMVLICYKFNLIKLKTRFKCISLSIIILIGAIFYNSDYIQYIEILIVIAIVLLYYKDLSILKGENKSE